MSYINKPPKNKNGVIPTKNGWIDAKTKEMLVSVRINPDIIEQWKSKPTETTDFINVTDSPLEQQDKAFETNVSFDGKETTEMSGDENTVVKKIIRKPTVKRKRIV